jgi:cell division transport system permease protein
MTESLDRETWQARVAAWWQATAPDWRDALARLGADTAYGLLTASAFLPLLEVYSPDHPGPALAALSELISDVGTELLSSLAQGAYDKAHASRRVEQEIAEHPDLRAEYQALLDRAAELMEDDFGEDFMKLGLPNPFYDMFSFNVDAAQMQADSLAQVREALRALPYVSDVFYQESLIDEVAGNLETLGWLALGIGLFFVIVAVTLIHNTVRLALYSNRFLIKNMQLVGASWGFISRPYLWRALGHGFIGSVLAILGLGGLLIWLRSLIPELGLLQGGVTFLYLFGALMVLGMLIYLLSTYWVVNKYLRMRVDDLYT